MSPKLSVNINKFATLRNARGGNNPNICEVAKDCQSFGAEGITVHPRPDARHIRYQDVFELQEIVTTEFNIEGYPDANFLQLVETIQPTQVTLVPDPPGVLTSNTGWDVKKHQVFLSEIVARLHAKNIRVSTFLDPNPALVEHAKRCGTDRIELYTENYATGFKSDAKKAILPYIQTAKLAKQMGLGINAGHDLDLENLQYFANHIPSLLEVSIGHALVCDALYFGLQNTVQMYRSKLQLR